MESLEVSSDFAFPKQKQYKVKLDNMSVLCFCCPQVTKKSVIADLISHFMMLLAEDFLV